jgi:hypothetical protein
MPRKSGVTRRAALAALAPAPLLAQGRGQPPLAPADQSEVDAKFANVVRKYGDRLTDDQKTRIRGVLGRHQRMLARIRAFPVDNGDAPATTLRLIPEKE